MTRRKVTMDDVARAAGVTQSTVSRVLSPSAKGIQISAETRDRVMAAVAELGFHPNQYARSLRGMRSRMIAILIADISNPFYHPLVRAVQDVAFQHGYDVMIANSDHTHDKERLFVESLVRRPVDGAVIIPYHLGAADLDDLIVRTGVAIAAVGSRIEHPRIDVSFSDDARASYELVQWLIQERGHRRLAMICANRDFVVTKHRLAAFQRALTEAGLEAPPEYVVDGDWTVETGQRGIQQLLELAEPPTAVFAASDTIAIGALEAAQEMGRRVPDDVAVVGFDDIPEAQWVRPRLTTVAQYPAAMGEKLATALFDRILGDADAERRVFEIPYRIIVRESA
jgi:LacI family transcriptional regulator, galactose operon repressor